MKLHSSLYMKWMAAGPGHDFSDFHMLNEGLLVGRGASGEVAGISAFQVREFNDEFAERVAKRMSREENSKQKFTLYIPRFIEHRVGPLLQKHKLSEKLAVVYTSFVHVKHTAGRIFVRDRMRVVNVDDSPVLLKFLKQNIEESGYIDVVGQVSNPLQAVDTIQNLKPDVITMDIQMPGMTGVDVVKALMTVDHYPIIMISSVGLDEGTLVFEALNSGAFDYIQKPKLEERTLFKQSLFETMLMAIEGRNAHSALNKRKLQKTARPINIEAAAYPKNLIWCIGSSTGGTQALTHIFTSMPNQIPPTFIVQHIPPVFSKAFADSLNNLCPFDVTEAVEGEVAQSNHVYIAPGGFQMFIEQNGKDLIIRIKDDPPVNRFKPSVDYMFNTVAKLKGQQIVATILTGMGRDGAEGLLALKKNGALTFSQDEATCTVYGMPRAAFEIGASQLQVPLDAIANTFLNLSIAKKAS